METLRIGDEKLSRRSTEQRQLLLEIIRQAEGHLDADEIYQRARQRLPSISLSTVYRSLQMFKELGLVEEHQFDGTRGYYEAMPQAKHHHLVCLGCGRIIEFKCPLTEKLKTQIGREQGFEVTEAEVRLVGYCQTCQKKLRGEGRNKENRKQVAGKR